jgi:hypothetical protein
MSHQIYKILSFTIVAPFTLRLCFDDGLTKRIDFEPALRGEMFEPLRELQLFEQVKLDPEVHTLVWPNGADFDPATLHDWPSDPGEVSAAVDRWQETQKSIP